MKRLRQRLIFYSAFAAAVVLVYLNRPLDASLGNLDDANRYELFSLDPYQFRPSVPAGGPEFRKHAILGSTLVTDLRTRAELNSALRKGIHASLGVEAGCFDPRHGIRVTHGTTITDFLICFECEQVEVWREDKQIARMHTTGSPQAVFDKVLAEAHVRLAPKPSG